MHRGNYSLYLPMLNVGMLFGRRAMPLADTLEDGSNCRIERSLGPFVVERGERLPEPSIRAVFKTLIADSKSQMLRRAWNKVSYSGIDCGLGAR